MIKLATLLKEIQGTPKAIFLAGPAGVGKSSTYKANPEFPTQLDNLLPSSFEIINSDIIYSKLLNASGIGGDQKNFTPDQLSKASEFQSQARKDTDKLLVKSLEDKKNIIIDGTGAASGPILKKKQQLEDLGYETFMVMVYASPLTALERNQDRVKKGERSLMPSIVLRTWKDVNKNIGTYEQAFGDNFVLIDNDSKDSNKGFSPELLKPYLQASSATGKPKTPEEIAKSAAEKDAMNKDIESMIKTLPKFDDLSSAKSKIQNFI
jgi:predicted ABC-type ATPase